MKDTDPRKDTEPEVWPFEVPTAFFPEIKAMAVLEQLFRDLDPYEVARVLRWAVDRFATDHGSDTA